MTGRITRVEQPISQKNGWRFTGNGSNILLEYYGTCPREISNRAHIDSIRPFPPKMLPVSMHVGHIPASLKSSYQIDSPHPGGVATDSRCYVVMQAPQSFPHTNFAPHSTPCPIKVTHIAPKAVPLTLRVSLCIGLLHAP